MFYTYVLRSKKDNKFYVGYTEDLKKRLKEHNEDKVSSTKSRKPLELIFYEAFVNKKDAILREKFLKTGWGRRHLKKSLKYILGGSPV
jgi:putative endonuclease